MEFVAPGGATIALLFAAVGIGCGRVGYDAHAGDGGTGPVDGPGTVLDARPDAAAGDARDPDASLLTTDYCAEIPPLPGAPVIDGAIDFGLPLRPLVPATWVGPGALPAGHSADYAVAWRPDGLYVYVDVVDANRLPAAPDHEVWCGDSIEVYADSDGAFPDAPDYEDPGTRQIVVGAPADAETPAQRGQAWCYRCDGSFPYDLDDTTAFIVIPRPDGYALEMLLGASELGLAQWTPSAGGAVGFDLAINVSEDAPNMNPCQVGSGDGVRLGQYFLRVEDTEPRYPFQNAAAFCSPVLLE